jgi:hypothetical protein
MTAKGIGVGLARTEVPDDETALLGGTAFEKTQLETMNGLA